MCVSSTKRADAARQARGRCTPSAQTSHTQHAVATHPAEIHMPRGHTQHTQTPHAACPGCRHHTHSAQKRMTSAQTLHTQRADGDTQTSAHRCHTPSADAASPALRRRTRRTSSAHQDDNTRPACSAPTSHIQHTSHRSVWRWTVGQQAMPSAARTARHTQGSDNSRPASRRHTPGAQTNVAHPVYRRRPLSVQRADAAHPACSAHTPHFKSGTKTPHAPATRPARRHQHRRCTPGVPTPHTQRADAAGPAHRHYARSAQTPYVKHTYAALPACRRRTLSAHTPLAQRTYTQRTDGDA